MSDVLERLDKLPPERQALLREILRRKVALAQGDDAVRPRDGGGPAPLSFAQQRLWVMDRLQPGSSAYNMPFALRLDGALDVEALERSLSEIVRRHEVLRTTFAEADGGPVQVIAPPAGFRLPVEELSALDEAEREAAVRRRASEDAARPFDLSAGPLFRAALLRLGRDQHVLLLCLHHIVTDGWSTGVLFRELSALYGAYREGSESPLAGLPVQYADHAVWQRERLRGDVLEREISYWRERLAGAPALLELPTDRPRPAAQSHRGARVPVELPRGLSERLRELGRGEDATPYMVLLAAFQVLLSKYGGGHDVVVGTAVAGRARREVEELIGFFVDTLVLRTDLSGDPTFREVLRRVREVTLDAYEHHEVPFEKLVEELAPERSLSHSPLFQVMFALQDGDAPGPELPGLRIRGVEAQHESAKFDLSLNLAAAGGTLQGALTYSTDLFEHATVERMLRHLERVLEQVAADADVRLSELALLDDVERRLVVEEWNRTDAAYPSASIHQLFREQAERTPDAVAVVFGHESLTYRELDERSNRLAHHLVRLGVGLETRVGLCLERGVEMVVSLLAILKAGGAYVPLDPGYPAERLALMLADARVAVLLTQESLRGGFPATDAAVVSVDGQREESAGESAGPPAIEVGPRTLAYVIYTSGSTGTPKGVAVEHRSVVRLVRGANYAELGPDQVILQAAPISFDASTLEIWGALLNGGRLVLVPGTNPSLEELGRTLVQHEVTTLWLTAGLFQVMVEERLDDLCGVRQLLAGGDVLPVEAVRRVRERFPDLRLINGYGPTENTTFTCCHTVGEGWNGGPVPIGRPISNTRVYVLDAALRPVPIGLPGELFAGGDGVARGYLGRPALTAERFIPDPFAATPGARLYRTGDRVRWRSEGVLEYLGRLDEQAKIRGFRIEPGEVETALLRHPGVAECTVVVREDTPGEKRLVAYVVGEAVADELRAQLRRSLPEYMLPAAFVALEHLPLDPNGKVDRAALPVPEFASAESHCVAPRTPAEEVLAGIWAEVLRLERVGVHDGFFDLGGHSLLATRVVSRVREAFGVELPLRALFEGPTVAELAERVEALRRAELPQLPPVVAVERAGPPPLSFAQERLWLLDRMEPGSAVYNVPAALRLSGGLDAAALERALGEIVRRHEALRTVFREVNGGPVQVITPFAGFTLPVEDLSALDEPEREAAVGHRAADEAVLPFDLSAGPLLRSTLLRLGDEEHVLLLSMHHVVADGWSLGVLFRELSALYAAYRDGRESPLADLAVQYADYAVWQREQLRGPALERELAWWRERLADAPALLELPTDRPRPAAQTHRGARVSMNVSTGVLERLRALGRREGATLYMVLLGAFQVLLAKYAGTRDVVVGSPSAGRTRREVEGLIGFFVNTLVLRTDLSGDPGFREVLRRVREVTLGAYEHQEMPFERLVEELRPERSLGHAPLFQVMFALDEAEDARELLPGLRVGRAGVEFPVTKFDLTLSFAVGGGGFRAALEYAADLFEPATAQRMLDHLRGVLEQVAADADARLSQLELAGEAERRLLLDEWSGTPAVHTTDGCIHRLIEAQAERTPDAVAVVFAEGRLTYRQLNERANRLAHHLAGLGVGPEARVAVCLERGPELIVSVLAVLKAGGAYVPLDPGYPAERVELMLADSAAAVLVTRETLRATLPVRDGVAVVSVDAARDEIARESAEPREGGAAPRNLAYVIYTSGSTGTPKGVGIEHRSLAAYLLHAAREYELRPGDRLLQFHSVGFDPAAEEIFATLLSGAALVLRDDEAPAGPEFWEACRRASVTVLDLPTAVWHSLVPHLEAGPGSLPDGLRLLVIGGEQAHAEPLGAWRRAAGGRVRLLNSYGPTETTIGVTLWDASAACGPGGTAVPIGRPVPGTRCYVLDGAMRPAPTGVPGELYVGGIQVARGYLGRPGPTAERFVPDPYSARPGGRLYRTGDRARWRDRVGAPGSAPAGRADAVLEYLGRLDAQVKIRGFRVEPGEVEAVLRRAAGVRECAVVAREDAPGGRRLVAYVAGEASADELRAQLKQSLPDYMVPAAFVTVAHLPLTPHGKLDLAALPAPEHAPADDGFAAPLTPVEEVLAGIWADVLMLERVGPRENFFELGGHSLIGALVMARIRETLAVALPLRALFEAPTVAELAVRVEELRRADQPPLPPVVPVARTGPLPLSFAQERLWFLDRLQPGSDFYTVPAALRLSGALRVPVLERALGEIVRRHEVLRTVFREVDGAPVQVVAPVSRFTLPVDDLSALPEAEREAEAMRRAGDDAARPFDLAAGPLARLRLLRLDADEHVLLLNLHHVVTDEWSTGVLFRELSALYEAYLAGGSSPLPQLAVQYADYAVWQREQLRGEALERDLAWWKERLAGAPALLELPTDRPRPAAQTYRGAHLAVELSSELQERLLALGRREGATPYMVLLGAFQVLLSKLSGSDDVVVGSPVAGRTPREVEELIGFFVNTLVVRTDLSGDPAFREVLRRVREVTLGAFEHQEVPFERLVAELQPERSLSHSPVFQVMFIQAGAYRPGSGLAGVQMRQVSGANQTSKFDLTLVVGSQPDGRGVILEYSTDLFERATIERMAGHLERLLEQVAADADVRLSEVELLGDGERRRVVEEWNRTAMELPAACFHELFEAHAARTPGAAAVSFGARSLTYGELNERANRLAHRLAALGVGPDVRVGICLARGPELIASVLAVLKAGGACVPLDPAYPAERLAFMLADAAAPVLLTQASLADALPALGGVRVLSVDGESSAAAGGSAGNPGRRATPQNLAYVLYTSGSTGTPKGVMQTHATLANLVAWHLDGGVDPEPRRTLQFASLSFDVSFQEIAVTLASGGELVLVDDELRRDPARLAGFLAERGVERLFLPFVALQALAEAAHESAPTPRLREVITAGEQLVSTPQIAALVGDMPGCRLINHYGPTETHVATARALEMEPAEWSPLPPIGRPVANTRVYVLDGALRPLPVGVPGGVYVGGAQVARGYLDRPALTAERFVPDPFADLPGARLYATGDRARWRAEGELEYLGRLDQQVKIRGFRVEPGEIEAVLRRHAGVRDCAVVAREDASGEKRLVAYVVGDAAEDGLRAHLRNSLPEHMVPGAFVTLERLPLTPSGKLDRGALPAPEHAATDAYVAPRNPVEEALAGIWAEVLGRERVGVHDNFFDLGGHSMLAVRVAARVRDALGVEVTVRALFENRTIDGLARWVSGRGAPVFADRGVERAAGPDASPDRLLALLDELPEEELDRLLGAQP